ncbi:MAG: S8 family peptidase [Bacteroidetes bacterium]|nr:S8 family peptidase [Bacteroidota bacterium]
MPTEFFPHIFLPSPPQIMGFTSVLSGGGKPRNQNRDRNAHAEYLRAGLDAAWQQARTRTAAVHAERQGYYLEFVIAEGCEQAIKSLESRRSGIRLLNVRRSDDQSGPSFATVYVPTRKSAYFLQKINAYQTTDTENGRPKNENLIQSIDDIRNAVLRAFWTDDPERLPAERPRWVEVWLRTENGDESAIERFRGYAARLELHEHEGRPVLRFPERAVVLVTANRSQLEQLMDHADDLAELRGASEPPTFFTELQNSGQAEWARSLLERLEVPEKPEVSICVLDTGINRGHALLEPLIAETDMHTVRAHWGTHDHHGHGTGMAGLAAFGDLQHALTSSDSVRVPHCIESAKIMPPSPEENPQELWGDVTAQGIARAEIQEPDRRRIVCMAVTSETTRERGRPSSWSGEIDQLAAGVDDGRQRLIIVSAGNIREPAEWSGYPESNLTNEVHDPAQAWNALTVGAYTRKGHIESDPLLAGYKPVAELGGLSPFSTTSCTWQHRQWPIKPEVVLEGGNVLRSPSGAMFDAEALKLLTTYHKPSDALFTMFDGTSAATAQAAFMAARIAAEYPSAWPETIRGLIVHSADWTDTMHKQYRVESGKGDYETLLRTCGYGVPNLERAQYCLRNSLTLIAQNSLQPYHRKGNAFATNEMHLFDLPWPRDVLLDNPDLPVTMRVTLSYFVEPGPGEIGWKDRYRYPSHGLRFELNAPGEDADHFTRRINKQARENPKEGPGTSAPTDHWRLGKQRDVGSIHSDVWSGTAAELAGSNLIAVHPTIGWWRERHHLGRFNSRCRYSLIVSIEAPTQNIDIYTPVALRIGILTPVPIEIRS